LTSTDERTVVKVTLTPKQVELLCSKLRMVGYQYPEKAIRLTVQSIVDEEIERRWMFRLPEQ
jgi:hypothetical protein